jgi:predicted metal-dependent enzyme (double-stranded beta helix superfamily)
MGVWEQAMLQVRNPTIATLPPRPAEADAVARLMAEIGAACDGPPDAMGARIIAVLRAAAAVPDLLSHELRAPRPNCYARHVMASDPAGRFTLLSLVWGPGQFSPPHAHDTWCAYGVVENSLAETLYRFDAQSGQAIESSAAVREPGYACFAPAGLEQIHRLGNAGGIPAISLHVYGVDGSRIGTHVNRLMDVSER